MRGFQLYSLARDNISSGSRVASVLTWWPWCSLRAAPRIAPVLATSTFSSSQRLSSISFAYSRYGQLDFISVINDTPLSGLRFSANPRTNLASPSLQNRLTTSDSAFIPRTQKRQIPRQRITRSRRTYVLSQNASLFYFINLLLRPHSGSAPTTRLAVFQTVPATDLAFSPSKLRTATPQYDGGHFNSNGVGRGAKHYGHGVLGHASEITCPGRIPRARRCW